MGETRPSLARLGSVPTVESHAVALAVGWELHGESRDATRKARRNPLSALIMRSR